MKCVVFKTPAVLLFSVLRLFWLQFPFVLCILFLSVRCSLVSFPITLILFGILVGKIFRDYCGPFRVSLYICTYIILIPKCKETRVVIL